MIHAELHTKNPNGEEEKHRVSSIESEQQEANNARDSTIEEEEEPEEEESRASEVRSERSFDYDVKDEEGQERLAIGDYKSLWSEFDDFVASENNGAMAEKSQQTNSRTFIKAVEEATDEASRRCALGLACRCRNKYNFRPANVPGYFVVDVPDYEPGGLAVGPNGSDQDSFEFIKNRARTFAFRKAVFEEFDETYAQAFAVQSSRPSK
ncbi:PWWP DOMAIN-CONTAINING PROTEIN [Salix purpurea]|uniref:PWWP DOMAIN-CONTAINING PROTEIN n=1 Tax=Salix purpurea TaxID=77065 RepID=A0A9Q0W8N8_SALPP|nr:PWWP DOMAIN-CONTAINING PROTEIN [Salix purpurea]